MKLNTIEKISIASVAALMVIVVLFFNFGTVQTAFGSPSQFTVGASNTSDHNSTLSLERIYRVLHR